MKITRAAAAEARATGGVRDVTAIAALLAERFPQRYPSPQAALDFTHRIVASF